MKNETNTKITPEQANEMAEKLIPKRRHPYGTGWGSGYLQWPQKEGFQIRYEAEQTTKQTILKISNE